LGYLEHGCSFRFKNDTSFARVMLAHSHIAHLVSRREVLIPEVLVSGPLAGFKSGVLLLYQRYEIPVINCLALVPWR
jgi:hypothetical protein